MRQERKLENAQCVTEQVNTAISGLCLAGNIQPPIVSLRGAQIEGEES